MAPGPAVTSRADVQQLRDRIDDLYARHRAWPPSADRLTAALEAVLDLVDRADRDRSWLVARSALVAELRRGLG